MKKYISLFLFLSFILTSRVVFSETPQRTDIEKIRQEREQEREKIQNEIKSAREEFQNQIMIKRDSLKEKSITNREQLKEKLKIIKNEKKQNLVLNISDNIEKINIKATDRLENLLENIENVLVKIKEKTDIVKANGSNVDEVYTLITEAEELIKEARTSITDQVGNTYKIEITDESTLKSTIQTIRDGFHQDIKRVQEKVKLAHEAVRTTAKSLGMIINLNDDENKTEEEKENTDTTTITTSSATN